MWLETRDDATVLRNIAPEELTSKMIYDAAVEGDAFAKELFEFTGAILGEAFCDFIAFSVPQAIILFGGLANAGELLLSPIRTRMNEKVVSFWKNKVDILQSSLSGADAAVLGASALGWK
jgi:glucokinase